MTHPIRFSLNGEPLSAECRADMTVLEWLRDEALLRGTKEGCAEGDCGACTILLKRHDEEKYGPVNSCILLMGQVEGAQLTTVEGLAASGPDGHEVQRRMAENGSSQCGFCTPGIVSSLAGLLEINGDPTESDIHDALAGNLCRCTGYRPIVEAAFEAAKANIGGLPTGGGGEANTEVGIVESTCHAPTDLSELVSLKGQFPDATLLAGGTDLSLPVAHARERWSHTILTRNVSELRKINQNSEQLEVGGAVTWQELLPYLHQHWPSFATMVRRFGSTQIRTMGTIAGNLANASPIGDGAPALLALGASLTLAGTGGERDLPLDEFFIDYRKSALATGEVIKSIIIPMPKEHEQFRVYKISKRYDQDISTVCGAFNLTIAGDIVTDARIAYGGMAATPMRSKDAEAALVGKSINDETIASAKLAVRSTFKPMDDMRSSAQYRSTVAANLVDRVALDIAGETVEVMAL